jgi:hypothetical protein
MFFMRKFLFFCLLLTTIAFSGEEEAKQKFLSQYYGGDYDGAHELLPQAFKDPITRHIWERRIHLNHSIPSCNFSAEEGSTIDGIALLRSGSLQQAKTLFHQDWLSLWGLATIALWQNEIQTSRSYVLDALKLSPARPELLYFAADTALSKREVSDYFSKFLASGSEDDTKKKVAEYAIEFLKKTEHIDLNVPSFPDGFHQLDSKFRDERLTISARINGKKKTSLLIDTGAGGLTLEEGEWQPQIATDVLLFGLGKKQIIKTTRVVLNEFQAGPFSIRNPVAAISKSIPGGGDINGVAGTVLFANHKIIVPLRGGREMALVPHDQDPFQQMQESGYKYSFRQTVPFYVVGKMIIVKGRIRNSPDDMDILIDTGAEGSILSAAAARKYTRINYPLSHEISKSNSFSGVGGRVDNVLISENVEVSIGSSLQKNFNRMMALNLADTCEGMELELDLILGRDFLNGYTLLIDYRNRQLTFLR